MSRFTSKKSLRVLYAAVVLPLSARKITSIDRKRTSQTYKKMILLKQTLLMTSFTLLCVHFTTAFGRFLCLLFSSKAARNTSRSFAAVLKAQKLNLCAGFLTTDPFCFLAVTQTVKSSRVSLQSLQSVRRYSILKDRR